MHNRISQLEQLVNSQLEGSYAKAGGSDDRPSPNQFHVSQDDPVAGIGRISIEDTGTTWVESDHWTAILDGICELKDSLQQDPHHEGNKMSLTGKSLGPELLVGGREGVSKQDILSSIPERPTVDRLLSQFIKSDDIAPMVLHTPTFLKEYESFWERQDQTPTMWIGLLFAIMCLAILHQNFGFELTDPAIRAQDDGQARLLAQIYRVKASQCLVLGNYTEPKLHVLETLLLYMHIEYIQSKDAQTGLWILLGILVRLALRMGYHRDASNFSAISPFQAEMRRRVWCITIMTDAGVAAQFGLPRMIRPSQSNTAEPGNLLDEDIREDMLELPSARPENVRTPVQYFVAKNRIVLEYGRISDLKTLPHLPQYAQVLVLDKALHTAYESVPKFLAMRSMSQSILDDPKVIMQRAYLAMTFNKAKCTLHRTYLVSAKTNRHYMYSQTACLEAALEILRIQQILDEETKAGGRLHADRGKISSLMRGDFLFATMILCTDTNQSLTDSSSSDPQSISSGENSSEKVVNALQSAYQIWLRSSESSREAQQAVRALRAVLDKARAIKGSFDPLLAAPTDLISSQYESNMQPFDIDFTTDDPLLYTNMPRTDVDDLPGFSPMDLEMVSV